MPLEPVVLLDTVIPVVASAMWVNEVLYDGKPAPLGFPVDPPPEMINGMHPDLVDGKQIANRFNRLDTQSAKAMPLTGNPEIDKKVKKARKQPK